MMRRFLTAMLGTMAGIWLSVLIFGVAVIVLIAVLVGRMAQETVIEENSILYIDLTGVIDERAVNGDVMTQLTAVLEPSQAYNEIIFSIKKATKDHRIKGIYINCGGSSVGIATREEIVAALKDFKTSGKWIYAYGDNITQGDYYIACVADEIYLNPVGLVEIHGLSATTLFYKDLMDKVGVEAQVLKVGTYKSAVEPYILTEMSRASREQQSYFLGRIWNSVSGDIASMRGVTTNDVNKWADNMIFTLPADSLVSYGVVDNLCYRHEIESKLKSLIGVSSDNDLNLVTPHQYYSESSIENALEVNPHIAVLYATGNIVDSGDEGIVGDKMAPMILDLAKDDNVKGLVLRVNSGGGSAFASEQIWEALEQFKKTGKPFYVSMGDYAASGGYYISCGADKIYADPGTLTGSIGIFGIIPCAKELMTENLGITSSTVKTNVNGEFPTLIEPMTMAQRNSMQAYVERGYETFVARCAEGRDMPKDSIKRIAEGRVWDGLTAKELGLVDEIGGLNNAVNAIASQLNMSSTEVKEYPELEVNIFAELVANTNVAIPQQLYEENCAELVKYIQTIKHIRSMTPMQCRMEEIIIQ